MFDTSVFDNVDFNTQFFDIHIFCTQKFDVQVCPTQVFDIQVFDVQVIDTQIFAPQIVDVQTGGRLITRMRDVSYSIQSIATQLRDRNPRAMRFEMCHKVKGTYTVLADCKNVGQFEFQLCRFNHNVNGEEHSTES